VILSIAEAEDMVKQVAEEDDAIVDDTFIHFEFASVNAPVDDGDGNNGIDDNIFDDGIGG